MVAKSDITACIGRGMCALTPKIESEYIYQFLLFYEDKWDGIAQGSTFSAINKNDINKIKLPVPKENGKINFIANILSTADKEIDLLEQKLEQLQKQKKALMQLLLTGIVRVTVNSLEGR
jgi:type I restriction enzyme S subunit